MLWADEVRERLTAQRDARRDEWQKNIEKMAKEFAESMRSFSVRISKEEANQKWGDYENDVIRYLQMQGFEVTWNYKEVRTGFLKMKREKVHTSYNIAVTCK